MMFAATTLLYPCVLAVLCLGSGLLVDRCARRCLPAPLLLPVGAAGLIAVSQLSTYVYVLAPATPYLMLALALAGMALSRVRILQLARATRGQAWLPAVFALAYLIALAPVLGAGRTTFSSYMTLSDSAVHLIGADFLIRHGQHYVHLDLRNSYGRFISGYYDNSNYPSGADTLFGGSAFLLGLPLIWAFQPFNAFILATAVGPAWMLARQMGLRGAWAGLASLTAVVPALVYAYELFGSIKEIVALPMIMALGAMIAVHWRWLNGSGVRAVPYALLLAGGISVLGLAFGAWALVGVLVPGALLIRDRGSHERRTWSKTLLGVVVAGGVLVIAAWPTWIDIAGSLKLASEIASTGNPGNLQSPLRAVQVLGVWLEGSYKLAPVGVALIATRILFVLVLAATLLGALHLLRKRLFALTGWVALTLLAWLLVALTASTWAAAKTLMLTSPIVLLLAWGGVAALRASSSRVLVPLAFLVAFGMVGGVLVSDVLQYHASNLAPTARYQELASLDTRFAGQGPTLFTDFDEYSMYELRDLDLGSPDFAYISPILASAAGGYGRPVQLDRISPKVLVDYPLIITRRNPTQSRPPAAYGLVWQGSYYQVWRRHPGATAAIRHIALAGSPARQCQRIGRLAAATLRRPVAHGAASARLTAAPARRLVWIGLRRALHPRGWGHELRGLVMNRPGRLSASFRLPVGGVWDVWVRGQLMPKAKLSVDGRLLAAISGQLSGNSLVPNVVPPIALRLAAGEHSLWVSRGGLTLAPGDGGAAVLDSIFLTPARAAASVRSVALSSWRQLCGGSYQWVELSRS